MTAVAPSDLYPAVRRFLTEIGLSRTLKAFNKETAECDDAGDVPKSKKKLAKKLAALELTEACQKWLEVTSGASLEVSAEPEDEEVPKKKKMKNAAQQAIQVQDLEPAKEPATEEKPRKKRKRSVDEVTAAVPEVTATTEEVSSKRNNKVAKGEKKPGVPFKRVDDAKWVSTIVDDRLKDNTHKAKNKFGDIGDSWGDRAAEDMLKVKGKGFRKEMAKKKRASWKGAGELDQGINSIKFGDNSDSEYV